MKIFYSILLVFLCFGLSSCDDNTCTVCTENNTNTVSDFCGTDSEVDLFEDELITGGNSVGQSWTCERD